MLGVGLGPGVGGGGRGGEVGGEVGEGGCVQHGVSRVSCLLCAR